MSHTAIVTGGSTGIGRAITERFTADGIDVYVVQRNETDAERGRELFDPVRSGGRVCVGAHDLSTGEGCATAVAACATAFGGVTYLINNAGVSGESAAGSLGETSDALIDIVIDTNLKAPLRLARESLALLGASRGVIVNISSTAQFAAQAEAAAYVSSKAGLGGLTRALALDLAPLGVRVVGIAPGDIATETSRSGGLAARRAATAIQKVTPVGYSADPEDVANAVAWVVTPAARFLTGTTIVLDGGLTCY